MLILPPGEVPEWEQIHKPITLLRWGDRNPSSAARVGGVFTRTMPTFPLPTFQRKKVQKGVKVRVEQMVTHHIPIPVPDSHHPILPLAVSLLTNVNTTQYWAVQMWRAGAGVHSICFFLFFCGYLRSPAQMGTRTSSNGAVLFLIITLAGSFSSWSSPTDEWTMESLVGGAKLECQG